MMSKIAISVKKNRYTFKPERLFQNLKDASERPARTIPMTRNPTLRALDALSRTNKNIEMPTKPMLIKNRTMLKILKSMKINWLPGLMNRGIFD